VCRRVLVRVYSLEGWALLIRLAYACTFSGEGNAYEHSHQLLRCVCMYSWLFM